MLLFSQTSKIKSVQNVSEEARDLFIVLDSVVTNIHSRPSQLLLSLIKTDAVSPDQGNVCHHTKRNLLKLRLIHSSNTL